MADWPTNWKTGWPIERKKREIDQTRETDRQEGQSLTDQKKEELVKKKDQKREKIERV